MSIEPGTRLGPYEVADLLGRGGMGEVYRARDSRLDRDVAIKVLPAELRHTSEWKRRLEREAKTISRLQHPNVCVLHDASFDGARDYLVMEYLAGETLAERLERGALPLADVARIGAEIAEAVAAAHRLGIVHRDLKPGNVMLTRAGAKVLDFGLSKGFDSSAATSGILSQSPTIAQPLSTRGTIAGTLHYMSPEQLEGREADARSDLWALGCVLYEMASGRRAFEGVSAASAIAAVMTSRPRALHEGLSGAPRRLDWLIESCLERDPERRRQSAKDLALELGALGAELENGDAQVAVGDARARPERASLRVSLELPAATRLTRADLGTACPFALSPDGSLLVIAAVERGESRLYRRRLDTFESEPIAGTEGATSPFFSPDGRWIGFFASGWLQKTPAEGGRVATVHKLPAFEGVGVDWGEGDQIVVSPSALGSGLVLLSADGRAARHLTRLDTERGELHHGWPQLLPGGKHVLFTVWGWKTGGATLVSLETGEVRRIVRGGLGARLIAPDLLVFRDFFAPEQLAVRFDLERLVVVGDPKPVQNDVYQAPRAAGLGSFCVSPRGTLVYEPAGSGQCSLAWVDREGRVIERLGDPGPYESPSISPDGLKVTFQLNETRRLPGQGSTGSGGDIWVHDLERGTRDRLTHERDNMDAVWSPDGEQVVFASNLAGPFNLYSAAVDGGSETRRLVEAADSVFPSCFAPDGSVLSFTRRAADGSTIGMVTREGELLTGEGSRLPGWSPVFSPDGRFFAYAAQDSGRQEVYVEPYPRAGQRWKISGEGGTHPRWPRSGGEIFYRRGDEFWVVPVETAPRFRPGRPRRLFSGHFQADKHSNYDVAADGQCLLLIEPEPDRPLRLVVGWVDEVRRRLDE